MNPPANTRDTTLTRSTLSPASQAGSAIAEGTEQPDDQQESPIHDPLMAGIGLILAAPLPVRPRALRALVRRARPRAGARGRHDRRRLPRRPRRGARDLDAAAPALRAERP